MTQLIYYVNALAAAGKTYEAVQFALHLAALGYKTAIAQPSKKLIAEWSEFAQQHNPEGVQITRIDSDTDPFRAISTLVKHVKHTNPDVGEVLFITHAALFGCPYWHNRANWNVIVDEVPEPVVDLSLTVPHRHGLLTEQVASAEVVEIPGCAGV